MGWEGPAHFTASTATCQQQIIDGFPLSSWLQELGDWQLQLCSSRKNDSGTQPSVQVVLGFGEQLVTKPQKNVRMANWVHVLISLAWPQMSVSPLCQASPLPFLGESLFTLHYACRALSNGGRDCIANAPPRDTGKRCPQRPKSLVRVLPISDTQSTCFDTCQPHTFLSMTNCFFQISQAHVKKNISKMV